MVSLDRFNLLDASAVLTFHRHMSVTIATDGEEDDSLFARQSSGGLFFLVAVNGR